MLKQANSLFLLCEISSAVLKTWKTKETETRITQNFQILYTLSSGVSCESLRPELSENVVLFVLAVFKVELLALKVRSNSKKKSRQRTMSQKKDTATILIFERCQGISVGPNMLGPR